MTNSDQFWHFYLGVYLTFAARALAINGCCLSYFEGTIHWHCYISCILTTFHCVKVSFFFSVVPWNDLNNYECLRNCEVCTDFCEVLYIVPHNIQYIFLNVPPPALCCQRTFQKLHRSISVQTLKLLRGLQFTCSYKKHIKEHERIQSHRKIFSVLMTLTLMLISCVG